MRRFTASVAKYYDVILARGNDGRKTYAIWAEASRQPINQLIDRYDLAGKSILSLGAGEAFEEFWFASRGCQLTLNDSNTAFIALLSAVPKAAAPGDNLDYIIGDAAEFLGHPDRGYDLVYASSFPPDELRREQIQETASRRPGKLINAISRRLGLRARATTWPSAALPYHDTLIRALDRVRPGGVAIFQHYRGGVALDANPHYLAQVAAQFARHGATLIEVYAYRKLPGNTLVVAFKGHETEARGMMERLRERPAITTFHGRFPDQAIRENVVKAFEFGNREVSPQSAFARGPRRHGPSGSVGLPKAC